MTLSRQAPKTRTRVSRPNPRVIVPALIQWFEASARDLPWRSTRDPYRVWISEIMLQQTQVATVLPYYERWMNTLPGLRDAANASEQTLLKLWEGLGYYSRVRNIKRAAIEILQRHGGVFPQDYDQVLALPGIGRYTAGAICSIAFGQPRPILDGNVARVLTRMFVVKGDPKQTPAVKKLWALAEQLVTEAGNGSEKSARQANHFPCGQLNESLMELGALICTPANPKCEICPVAHHCEARRRGLVHAFPEKRARPKAKSCRLAVFVVEHGTHVLVRRRGSSGPNAGFWELPSVEANHGQSAQGLLELAVPGIKDARPVALGSEGHTIMNQRILMEACLVRVSSRTRFPGLQWKQLSALKTIPCSTITRKALQIRFEWTQKSGSRGNGA